MPPPFLLDIGSIDLDRVVQTREQIYGCLPHRFEFMLLDGLLYSDVETGVAVAYRDIRADEFWVRGHLPGRPLFPGILMIEAAAHLAAYVAMNFKGFEGRFLGLGGVNKAKFRHAVVPGDRMLYLVEPQEVNPRRITCAAQGVVDGKIVFEAEIRGMPM